MPEPTSTTTSPNTQEGSGDDKTAAERPSGAQDARASPALEAHGNSNPASEKRDMALHHARKALDAALPDVQLTETKNGFMLIVEAISKRPDKKQDAISAITTLCQCLRAEPGPLADLSERLELCFEMENALSFSADDHEVIGRQSKTPEAPNTGRFSFRDTVYSAAASAFSPAIFIWSAFTAALVPPPQNVRHERD